MFSGPPPSRPPVVRPVPRETIANADSAVNPPDQGRPPCFPPDPIPRILPGGGVSLLAGAPGCGKTALVSQLCALFRDGEPILGHDVAILPAIGFLAVDRSWLQSSRLWFEAAGYPDIPHYSLQDDAAFNKRLLRKRHERITVLRTCLQQLALPPQSLVVVDPLALFLGGNLNDYDACMIACVEIRDLCRELQLTILGLAHAGKQKADPKDRYLRLQDRIVGSTALFGYTDTQMYLASPEELNRPDYTFLWHPHHAPAETFRLTRRDDGLFHLPDATKVDETWPADLPKRRGRPPKARDLEVDLTHAPMPADLAERVPSLLALLSTTPLAFKDIKIVAAPLQMSVATLHRTLQHLIQDGRVRQPERGQYQLARLS